jgi:hypothetical protein
MPRIAVILNVQVQPKKSLLRILLGERSLVGRLVFGPPDCPAAKYKYDLFDFCNNCYPPTPKMLAKMACVTEAQASQAIRHANFEGSFHEPYEEDDYICCLCGKTLDNTDD